MKLLKFPWLVLIKILKFMETIDLINLSTTNRRLREQYTNEINPGRIKIFFDRDSAVILIGEIRIEFSTDAPLFYGKAPTEIRTIGPVTIDAFCTWSYEVSRKIIVEDIHTPCLTLAQYCKTTFPKAELDSFSCEDEINERTLQILSSWDLDLFKEKEFEFPAESKNIKNLASQYCKKNHLCTIGYEWDGNLIIKTKNYGEVESEFRFSDCWQSDYHCINYILVSCFKVGIQSLRHLINTWIQGELYELIFVRASVVTGLNMSEVTEGFRSNVWNDEDMIEFKERTDFSVYFEQKGTIIFSKSYGKASLHFDQDNSIFTMVVWDTGALLGCRHSFPEIQTLFLTN